MLTKHILPIAIAAGTLMLSSAGSQALPVARQKGRVIRL